MSVDHLPARTTKPMITFTPDEAQEITRLSDETMPAAGETLDHSKVHAHRDWRQHASEVVGLAAGFTAAAAAGGMATNTLLAVSHTLAVVAGALVGLLVWLLTETAREGRRWVYAESDDPADPNQPASP